MESTGVLSRRWVWVVSMGVASGCGCKEIDFLILPIPSPLVSAIFCSLNKIVLVTFVIINVFRAV